jgi:hypothetical protein
MSNIDHSVGQPTCHTIPITVPYPAVIATGRPCAPRLIHPGVHHMPNAHIRPEPSLLPIERPRCPKCQGRMMLARIECGPAGPIYGPLSKVRPHKDIGRRPDGVQ